MKRSSILSATLVLSAVFLIIGGAILRLQDLVPLILTLTTVVTVAAILLVAHFVHRGKAAWIHIGAALAVLSIVFNSLQPAHTEAILHPLGSAAYTLLVVSDIIGFYALPVLYLIVYVLSFRFVVKPSAAS